MYINQGGKVKLNIPTNYQKIRGHAIKRYKERYKYSLSIEQYSAINDLILNKKCIIAERKASFKYRIFYLVNVGKKKLCALFDWQKKQIVTFYPANYLDLELLIKINQINKGSKMNPYANNHTNRFSNTLANLKD